MTRAPRNGPQDPNFMHSSAWLDLTGDNSMLAPCGYVQHIRIGDAADAYTPESDTVGNIMAQLIRMPACSWSAGAQPAGHGREIL